jgi:arylsulfatase A-like enzyme/Tfp pilus assembly protein PilF
MGKRRARKDERPAATAASAKRPALRASRRWLLVALLVPVLVVAIAWVRGRSGSAVRRDPGLSVLLVTIDTLRADALGAYGQADAATPWIDRLAREGVRFERAHAHNVVTLPSHANILSGRYPFGHGIRDNSGFRFPAGTPTLASILKARGWRTGAFVSAFPLDSRFGLDEGFESYDDRLGGREIRTAFLVPQRAGAATVEAALAWQGAHRAERTLTFVHLYEPHFPYDPPEPFAARFRGRPYQGEVAAADAALEKLLRPILEQGASGRTLVVFTADHGEGLGDHGELTHGIFAYEATLRVPLVLYAPGLLAPGVVRAPARHVDLLPTILDALGIEPPPDLPGRSLLALAAGRDGEAPPRTYFEALSPSLNQGWAPLHGVVDGALKYVDLPLPELYDLDADPGETRNLVATRAEDLERIRGLLAAQRKADRGPERIQEDQATLEKLHALGYVAGGNVAKKERYTDEDDPKRLIDIDVRNRDVIRLYREGDLAGAVALCEENIRRRPNMPMAYLHLAYLKRAQGDLPAAIASARKAFEMQPLAAESVSLYTVYLTEAGRAKEAADVLEPYMTAVKPDLDVITSRGMALAALRKPAEALATFERGREVDPSNPLVLVNIGTVYLMTGDRARAREAFEGALDIDGGVARAHNSLGVIAAQEGRMAEAVERWRRAVELDPRDYQTLFNLGVTLRGQGRAEEARPYLEAYLRSAPPALEARDIARVRGWLASGGGAAVGS